MDAPTCLITPRPYEFFPFFMFASGRRVSSSFWCKNYVSRPHASRHRRVLRDVKLTVNSFFSFYLYLWSNRKLLFDEKVSKSDKKTEIFWLCFQSYFFLSVSFAKSLLFPRRRLEKRRLFSHVALIFIPIFWNSAGKERIKSIKTAISDSTICYQIMHVHLKMLLGLHNYILKPDKNLRSSLFSLG